MSKPLSRARSSAKASGRFAGPKGDDRKSDSTGKRKHEVVEESEEESEEEEEDSENSDSGVGSRESEVGENDDDEHRVSQWVDEDELGGLEVSDGEESEMSEASGDDLDDLQENLKSLPFGALIRARQALSKTGPKSNNDNDDSDSDSDASSSKPDKKGKEKAIDDGISFHKQEWGQTKPVETRAHKHAPTEMTSKKPVTRRRQVVELHKIKSRDPRFSDLSGTLNPSLYHNSYSFLPTLQKSELETLKTSLKAARKALANSPQHLREEREIEVEKLERALKRSESNVSRAAREERERKVLSSAMKEETHKREEGKKGWWMKESDKRALLTKARFEELEATGGKKAVKKAVEKRKKKVAQKDKKSRPFAPPGQVDGGWQDRGAKRRKVG